MRKLAVALATGIGITVAPAFAQDDAAKRKAIEEAKQRAKDKAEADKPTADKPAADKPADKPAADKPAEAPAAGDDGEKAFGRDVEGENEKHKMRLEKIARLEQIGKEHNKPQLVAKAAELREKENRRHERALARLARKGGPGDNNGKGNDDKEKKSKPPSELTDEERAKLKEKVKDKIEEKKEKLKEKKEKKEKKEGKGK